jgi:cardiolipin synthase
LADKMLLIVSYVSFGYLGIMPLWLVGVVLGRDALILSGSFTYWRITGHFEGNPTWLGKTSTFVAMTAAVWTLLHLAFWPLPQWLLPTLYVLVALLGGISALQYVVLGLRAIRPPGGRPM